MSSKDVLKVEISEMEVIRDKIMYWARKNSDYFISKASAGSMAIYLT